MDAAPAVDARVEDTARVQGDASVALQSRTIEVAGLGTVEVAFNESHLEITSLEATSQASAAIRSQTETSAVIDFSLDGETSTLFVSVVEGDIVTSLVANGSARAGATANARADAEANAGADAEADSDSGTSSTASGGAEAEVGIFTQIGIDLGLDG